MKVKIFLLAFSVLSIFSFGQSKKNLEVIFGFVDESLTEVKKVTNKNVVLEFNAADNLEVIKGRVLYNLGKSGKEDKEIKLNYTVDAVGVNYPEMFRDGLFGDFFLEREVYFNGYFSVLENDSLLINRSFDLTKKDTVALDELSLIETQILDFTKGEVPPEPAFDSIVETVVAVGAAVISVILFFTVRSE